MNLLFGAAPVHDLLDIPDLAECAVHAVHFLVPPKDVLVRLAAEDPVVHSGNGVDGAFCCVSLHHPGPWTHALRRSWQAAHWRARQ